MIITVGETRYALIKNGYIAPATSAATKNPATPIIDSRQRPLIMVATNNPMTKIAAMAKMVEVGMTAFMSVYNAPAHLPRSEEHTSELQSRFDLVRRLLLEKKKTIIQL